jgi:hypothetical protein
MVTILEVTRGMANQKRRRLEWTKRDMLSDTLGGNSSHSQSEFDWTGLTSDGLDWEISQQVTHYFQQTRIGFLRYLIDI